MDFRIKIFIVAYLSPKVAKQPSKQLRFSMQSIFEITVHGAGSGLPINPLVGNPFGMPSPYGLNPLYDGYMMGYGMNGLGMGIPYGGYGMYGMNGMMNGMNGMNGMNTMNGMNGGMNGMQNTGTINNGNTMRSNRISGSRTRYGSYNQGCGGGCSSGGWLDAKKLKKA
ncbi:hypothetical protein RB195_011348 [Necator americanus]|uniref:Uncharacterized protein n=1 Tax=Necator americanus TaxID=51031 RepID=A0ABR1D464_NECAM